MALKDPLEFLADAQEEAWIIITLCGYIPFQRNTNSEISTCSAEDFRANTKADGVQGFCLCCGWCVAGPDLAEIVEAKELVVVRYAEAARDVPLQLNLGRKTGIADDFGRVIATAITHTTNTELFSRKQRCIG